MQNEELRQAQLELDASRARYFSLYDLAPVGYCTINEQGLILEANLTAANLLGVAQGKLSKLPISRFIRKEDQDIYCLLGKEFFAAGEPQTRELRMVRQDGTSFWAYLQITLALTDSGETFSRLMLSDITNRKQAEEALHESHRLNRQILDSITDAFISLTDDMVVIFFNAAAERILNHKHQDVIGRKLFDVFPEAKGSIFEENYAKAICTKVPLFFEVEFTVAPYQNWYEVRVYPSVEGITIYFQVITARKQAEETKAKLELAKLQIEKSEEQARHRMEKNALEKKIRKSDELYRTIIETAHDAIWIFDVQGNFVFINRSAAELSGYQPSELIGKHFDPFVHPEDRQHLRALFTGHGHGERKSFELRAIPKNGQILILTVNSVTLFDKNRATGIVAFGRDITKTRQAEIALQRERDTFKGILEAMTDGVYIVDQKYQIEYVNPALAAEFGEVQGRKCYEYFHDRTEPCEWCKNPEVFSGKDVRWEWSSAKTGKTYSLFDTAIRNRQGAVCKLEIFHDITQRKQAADVLERERAKLLNILENMQHGVYIVNTDHDVEYINPVIEGQFGPLNDRKCYFYFNQETNVCPWCQIEEVFAGKTIRHERVMARIGKIYDVIDTPIINADGSVSKMCVISDITEIRKTLENLQNSQERLRHLSSHLLNVQDEERRRISRELHDELGQTMTVIKLRLRLLQKKLPESQNELIDECEEILDDVNHLIEESRRLSKNLSPAILEQLGLSTASRQLLNNFARHSNVKLRFEIDALSSSLPMSACLSIYRVLQQALTNIEVHAQANNVFVSLKHDQGHICLTVEDDGKGFSAEKFLLAQPKDKGLGLAIMEERAHMFGGGFEFWSREGLGTRLVFKIPVEKEKSD